VATFATTHNATEASATQFGGTDAVSATVATSITQAAKGQAGMTGLTAAPNLTTVGTPAASLTAGFSTVTVNFDKTAYLTGVGGFGIVYADATVTGGSTAATGVCTVTSPAKGTGSMAFTLRCPNDPTGSIVGPALTAAQISRVIDLPGTVTTTAGGANPNPEEATTGQNTMANFPDLTGVAIALKATATTDTITYTFNSLSAGQTPAPADFAYINFDGTTGTVAATTVAQSVSNANQVVATYPVGTLSNAVAGIVKAGAVSNDAGAMNLDNEMA
ncbi:MAG: hypothetical protein ACRD0E_11925, partial [Acidimicrobiales bacterium]